MATNGKRIGLYTGVGIAAAVLIIAAIFASGIQFPSSQRLGTLHVSITDAPVDLKNLQVTVSALYVNSKDGENWVQLPFTEGKTEVSFDLLALNNVNQELSIAQLPAGNYTKIRLEVTAADATFEDGTTQSLKVPPGHIDIIISFEIKESQVTNLLIDMQPDTAAISASNNFKPILKATVE